jgi:hypothetical protein
MSSNQQIGPSSHRRQIIDWSKTSNMSDKYAKAGAMAFSSIIDTPHMAVNNDVIVALFSH